MLPFLGFCNPFLYQKIYLYQEIYLSLVVPLMFPHQKLKIFFIFSGQAVGAEHGGQPGVVIGKAHV